MDLDNIDTTITNSEGEIELNFIEKQKLAILNKFGSSQAPLLLPETSFDDNLDANSSFWPIDNKEKISDIKDLGGR